MVHTWVAGCLNVLTEHKSRKTQNSPFAATGELGSTLATSATSATSACHVEVELYWQLLDRSKFEKLFPYRDIAAMKPNNEVENWPGALTSIRLGNTGDPPTGDNSNSTSITVTEREGNGACMSDEIQERMRNTCYVVAFINIIRIRRTEWRDQVIHILCRHPVRYLAARPSKAASLKFHGLCVVAHSI